MKKKPSLLISGVISAILIVLSYVGIFKLCGIGYSQCADTLDDWISVFSIIIFTFLFSLITYWMKNEVFTAWFRFTRVWVPLSMVAIFLAPSYASDWMFPIEKGTVLFIANILFVSISLIIIARAWWRGRRV